LFIRKQRKKWVLLHSCRDGSGRVYHRRLGHCVNAADLELRLDDVEQRCPEVRFDRAKLLAQLKKETQTSEVPDSERDKDWDSDRDRDRDSDRDRDRDSDRDHDRDLDRKSDKIRRSARTLLRLLAEEEDAEVLRAAHEELVLLSARLRGISSEEFDDVKYCQSRLSPVRRQFDRSDPQARPYLEALDKQSNLLHRQGRLGECLAVLGRRVGCCPTSEAQIRYGTLLQEVGLLEEAAEQYARLSNQDPRKHYNLASLSFLQGRKEEALVHLLRGLTHDPQANLRFDEAYAIRIMSGQKISPDELLPVGPDPSYWNQYGHLWTAEGQNFVNRICSQPLVRFCLRKSRETEVKPRNLVPISSRKLLLERVEDSSRSRGLI